MWVRLFLLVCLVCLPLSVEAATYYVDFTAGSDSNNGTSTGTAWKRVKGMTGVTGTAASTSLTDGDIIKFKGGETWTSSTPWTLEHGTAAMVTYTTDHTWYTGGAFSQPIIDDQSANRGNAGMIRLANAGYVTFNDFYFKACGVLNTSDVSNQCLKFTNTHDITITNSTLRTYSWISIYLLFTTPGSYSNFTFTGNDIANTSSMLWIGSGNSTSDLGNYDLHTFTITNNVVHDISSQLGGLGAGNPHGNGFLHYFSNGNPGGLPHGATNQYIDGMVFCNNRSYGDFHNAKESNPTTGWNIVNTAFYFVEGSVSGLICNNDFSYSPAGVSQFTAAIFMSHSNNAHPTTLEIYNNTIAGNGVNAMSAALYTLSTTGMTLTVKNNIISGTQYALWHQLPNFTSLTTDYNNFRSTSGQLIYGASFQSYATWQAAGRDTHSLLGNDPLLVSVPDNQHLQPTSPVIGLASNLTSLGYTILNSDRDSVARGSTWDMGAYMQQGGSGAPAQPGTIHTTSGTNGTTVAFVWPPSTESDLAGYRVYRGTTTGQTDTLVKEITLAGAAAAHTSPTTFRQQLPIAGTYYYTITSYNTNAQESVKSAEISTVSTGLSRTAASLRGGHQ